jgi:hypothetical protein
MSGTAPQDQHESRVESRLVRGNITELFILGLIVASGSAWLIHWYNHTPELMDELRTLGTPMLNAIVALAGALLLLSFIGSTAHSRSLRRACILSLFYIGLVLVTPLFLWERLSFIGFRLLVLTLSGIGPSVLAAFFGAAAVRHLVDAWRKLRVPEKAVAAQLIACAGFVLCVYLAVCLRIFGQLRRGD